MDNMIKFYRGLVANLPATGVNGALYITTDEGAIYYGTGTGMKRLGDFIQVANVAALPEKAHESCLYYCVAENILAKWNGSEWKQINKQPTAAELKTLLGLGSLAYLSEVGEDNLNAALKEKVNAAAEGNHSHGNKTVLDGITAEKVEVWDNAEENAKGYADGLNTAMNTRVEALEAVDHTHGNKELLDTYTQTEANLADAVAKKHAHTFNETELNKIVEGDVAKWNGVAADHLTSADKTTLENAIKEAKKAGTDANTNIETYKVANDARVLAVEEDVAEIVDGTNGILAQAKSYSDGKLATARTEITAEIDADVKVVNDALEAYKTANDQALAGVKATADAAAVKTEVEAELAKKVDKEGYIAYTQAEKNKLAGISEGANKVEKSETNGNIKVDGQEVVVYTHPEKHAIGDVTGLQDALDGKQAAGNYSVEGHKHVKADITDFAHTHTKSEITDFAHTHVSSEITDLDATIKSYDYATKTELGEVDKKFEGYVTTTAYATDKQGIDAAIADRYTKGEADAKFAIKGADAYDDTVLKGRVTDLETESAKHAIKTEVENALALKADKSVVEAMYTNEQIDAAILVETNRAKGVEESLQTQINTIMNNPDTEGVINSINEFTQYIADHGEIAEGFRTDIDKNKEDISTNAQAIAGEITRATGVEEALAGRIDVLEAGMGEHTHSWNDLTDRPFYEAAARTPITFEPTDEALENSIWINYGQYVKVSDEVFGVEDLKGATVLIKTAYGEAEEAMTVDAINEGVACGRLDDYSLTVVSIATPEAAASAGLGNCEAGTYFEYASNNYVSALVFTGTLKQLDEKFIPDTIVRTTDLATAAQELKTSAANQDAVVLAEAQAYADQAEADAIAAAKTETEKQVKALAEGQVDANKNDIANLLAQMTWGEF